MKTNFLFATMILGGATIVAMFFPSILNIFAIAGGIISVT